jgi:hypothetical protein
MGNVVPILFPTFFAAECQAIDASLEHPERGSSRGSEWSRSNHGPNDLGSKGRYNLSEDRTPWSGARQFGGRLDPVSAWNSKNVLIRFRKVEAQHWFALSEKAVHS